MASVSKHRDKYIIRVKTDVGERKISGFTNKREAERVRDKILALETAKKTGEMPRDVAVWVAESETKYPELRRRLASFGLVELLEEKRTLIELLEVHRQRADVIEGTRLTWDHVRDNLLEFFSGEKAVADISQEDAQRFDLWLRTEPLNRRNKKAVPYAKATVSKRIGIVKTIFHYAEKIGWIDRNPFRFLKSGDSTNPDKLEYVPREKLLKVVETAPLYWRMIMLFGRFCGVRGPSELYRMEWGDIHLSTAEENGWIAVRTKKNERHGRTFRVVPLPSVLEKHLIRWAEQAREGEKLLFPGMEKDTNFPVMVEKLIVKAGLPVWKNPWYNLRKSFCSDLLPVVKDITTCEQITDHSYTVAAKHYQIMTGGRLATGMEQALEALDNTSKHEVKPLSENALKNGSSGDVFGDITGDMRSITPDGVIARRDSQVPVLSGSTQETKDARDFSRAHKLRLMGLEPMTCGLKVSCSTD